MVQIPIHVQNEARALILFDANFGAHVGQIPLDIRVVLVVRATFALRQNRELLRTGTPFATRIGIGPDANPVKGSSICLHL